MADIVRAEVHLSTGKVLAVRGIDRSTRRGWSVDSAYDNAQSPEAAIQCVWTAIREGLPLFTGDATDQRWIAPNPAHVVSVSCRSFE